MMSDFRSVVTTLHWISHSPFQPDYTYLIRNGHDTLCGCITPLRETSGALAAHKDTSMLHAGDIRLVLLETHRPMTFYAGADAAAFEVVDPIDQQIMAHGTIEAASLPNDSASDPGFTPEAANATPGGGIVWFTGLSASGKTTLAHAVHVALQARGIDTKSLDADLLRQTLNRDLGFSKQDRDENIRRISFVARMLSRKGCIVLVAAISPYRAVRDEVRASCDRFLEVYVSTPLAVCERRDPKGLYQKARAGQLLGLTGIDDAYEPPQRPEVRCDTSEETLAASTQKVLSTILGFL